MSPFDEHQDSAMAEAARHVYKHLNQQDYFVADDETFVSPFLNAQDAMSTVPWDLLDGFSVAAGRIEPGQESLIQAHPLVTQVTYVLEGVLTAVIKDPGWASVDTRIVGPQEAILTRPGAFLQLINQDDSTPTHVLYLVSPPFLFEPGPDTDSPPVYSDALVFGKDWEALERQGWTSTQLDDLAGLKAARQASAKRVAAVKGR